MKTVRISAGTSDYSTRVAAPVGSRTVKILLQPSSLALLSPFFKLSERSVILVCTCECAACHDASIPRGVDTYCGRHVD